LDWKKAFDSVNTQALNVALRRFGLPPKILRLIDELYSQRSFAVRDGAHGSTLRAQRSGISQGCPLSPFLFTMTMTVIVQDALEMLPEAARRQIDAGSLNIVLYADDTLLIGSSAQSLQQLLDAIATVGQRFGMELHWDKFQLMEVGGKYELHAPNGSQIQPSSSMCYLGCTMFADGGVKSELNRKLGIAWSDFKKLARVWGHAQMRRRRKMEAFQSMIASRLLYGLSSAWLNVAEIRRLNGFQARCLRVILGVKPAFYSRISNATVLTRSGQTSFALQLRKQQLMLYGRIARLPPTDPRRSVAFCANTVHPLTSTYVRKVGRPRNEWTVMLQRESFKMSSEAHRIVHQPTEWSKAVERYCS